MTCQVAVWLFVSSGGLQLERVAGAHVCGLSSRARVLTLCLQCLGVSENAAPQSRGHCPVEPGQET